MPRPTSAAPDEAPDAAPETDEHDIDDAEMPRTVSEDDVRAIESELAEARRRLAETPVEVVVLNHAMGLYELAAIHLSNEPPSLRDAVLAIDAFACLVEGLGDRLGPEAGTLRNALNQIRLAFVQVKGSTS